MGPASTPRLRFLILWSARLALFAFLFQVSALGHWRPSPSDVIGLPDSDLHAAHCHGDATGCADSSTSAAVVIEVSLTPVPTGSFYLGVVPRSSAFSDIPVAPADKPPRLLT